MTIEERQRLGERVLEHNLDVGLARLFSGPGNHLRRGVDSAYRPLRSHSPLAMIARVPVPQPTSRTRSPGVKRASRRTLSRKAFSLPNVRNQSVRSDVAAP